MHFCPIAKTPTFLKKLVFELFKLELKITAQKSAFSFVSCKNKLD
jgi:hypothetical protein